ncbi:MAG: ABC transporter permease, partial [Candidatus Thiodiazotropha taylori]|nr:ABC transporter permease [Candidatus Thiodiazotropha taylori]MCW4251863.1 ABC transporter permease [Candidatus Thiodiazotropha taylori]
MTDQPSHRQTYWRRILGQTFVRWGARLGLGWVALLAMIGIFAPFLASSFPLLLSQNGVWSSPVLTYLQAEDVLFLIAFFSLLLVLPWRISGARKLGLFVLMVSIGGGLAYSYVDPPKLVIYEQYRVAEREGVYDWVVFAPVPYSPKDYQRALGDTGLEAPLSQAERPHFFGTEQNGA